MVIATMNPSGDHGKKELSPALRNRFTELWVESPLSYDSLNDPSNGLDLENFMDKMILKFSL
jgi:midasin